LACWPWPTPGTSVTVQIKLDQTKIDGKVVLLKLDLEGGEFHAMQGGESIIKGDMPLIVFENSLKGSSITYNYSMEDFFSFFERIDYVVYDFFGNKVDENYWNSTLQTYMFWAGHTNLEQENLKLFKEIINNTLVQSQNN
jgi:hypothetical protein